MNIRISGTNLQHEEHTKYTDNHGDAFPLTQCHGSLFRYISPLLTNIVSINIINVHYSRHSVSYVFTMYFNSGIYLALGVL